MKRLKDIMTPLEECLNPGHTLEDALKFNKSFKFGAIPVINNSGKLIGAFTRSSFYDMITADLDKNTTISEYIRKNVITVLEDTTMDEMNGIVANSTVGTGIVVNHLGEPTGLFTKTDAVMNYLQEARILKGQLEKILQTSNIGSVMSDENGWIIYVNDRFLQMIGKEEKDIMHKNIVDIIPNFDVHSVQNDVYFRMKLQASHFMVRVSKYDITDRKQGFISLFQNVSELEQMTQELESIKKWKSILQSVIDNAYDGLIMINELNEIVFVSSSLLELFNVKDESELEEQILPYFQLSQVLKTGVAEISDFMEYKGINYIVQRIPVYQDDQIIGAIGKVIYRQLHEVRERFKKAEESESRRQFSTKKVEISQFCFDEILTQDPFMLKLIKSGIKAAKGRSTILIRGESGTGKELFAHAIHNASSSQHGPLITVNCAAIPEHLLESEFFGYAGGAFTGAKDKGKIGKFDMAHGGTLFLDEVGDMSLQLQAKLLRVLQERGFYRVGGTERIEVDIRIIAATNQPLEKMVEEGKFREDLFYRLNVISFEIPPLRKRKKDITLLSESFIHDLNKQNGTSITGWMPTVYQALMEYDWPGNVRELRNVWERAMVFAESGKVKLEDLPEYVLSKIGYDLFLGEEEEVVEKPLLEVAERLAIQKALELSQGNKSYACKILGISRSVLYEKLKKYEILDVE